MTRLVELNDLHDQAVRHALVAERTGLLGTARALMALARDLERERRELLSSREEVRPAARRSLGAPASGWMGLVAGA